MDANRHSNFKRDRMFDEEMYAKIIEVDSKHPSKIWERKPDHHSTQIWCVTNETSKVIKLHNGNQIRKWM